MMSGAVPSVVVVVYDDHVQSGVARCALKHRWEILDGRTERSLSKRIMLAHPKAMLVQTPTPLEPATSLIARVRQMFTPPAILAVAGAHTELVEVQMRSSGVQAYLTQDATAEDVEQAVRSIAPGAIAPVSQVETKTDQAHERAARVRVRRTPRSFAREVPPLRHQRRAE